MGLPWHRRYRRLGGLDPDVHAWRAAIVAAGSSVSASTVRAADVFTRRLKSAGLWDKCHMIDLCCGDNLTAALVRLKVPSGVSRAYMNNNFVSADYAETNGMTGNGSTKYLNSGLNPVSLGWSDSSLMMWACVRTTAGTGSRCALGVSQNSYQFSLLLLYSSGGGAEAVGIKNNQFANLALSAVAGQQTGFLGGGTNGSRSQQFYRNGVASGSAVTATGTAFPSASITKFAHRESAQIIDYSARTLSSAFITRGLIAAEIVTLYNIVAEFEAALGRPIPS